VRISFFLISIHAEERNKLSNLDIHKYPMRNDENKSSHSSSRSSRIEQKGGGKIELEGKLFCGRKDFLFSLSHHFVCGIKERIDSAMTICWRTQIVLRAWEIYRRGLIILKFGAGIESKK
jgi:hypothetical protein